MLPCGAGKTLVGVTAAQTIKKRTMCLCTSKCVILQSATSHSLATTHFLLLLLFHSVSCQQWQAEFEKWSTIASKDILIFTSETKDVLVCCSLSIDSPSLFLSLPLFLSLTLSPTLTLSLAS